MKRWTAST